MNSLYRIVVSWVLILVLIGTVISFGVPVQASPEAAGSWSAVTNLSGTEKAGVFPEIAVDSSGVIHVVYEETADLAIGQLSYKNNSSGSFGAAVSISGQFNQVDLAAIDTFSVDGQEQVHVVFAARMNGTNNLSTRIYYVMSPNGGATWTAPLNVSGDRVGFQPDLAIDDLGHAHVAFNSSASTSNLDSLAVFYVTNASGSWSVAEKAGEVAAETSYNGFPSMTTNFVNNVVTVHILFMGQINDSGQVGKSVYSVRKVGAAAWTAPALRGSKSANFADIVSFANNVYAVWEGAVTNSSVTDLDIYYSVSADNGATWSAPVIVGNNRDAQGTRAALGRALDGSLMVLWDDQFNAVGGNTDIWSNYSPDGINWAGAGTVFQGTGFSLETEVAGSCEFFHAVWHDSNIGGTYKVFFSQTGPTVTPNCPVTVVPVTFDFARTSASTSKSATITGAFNNVQGEPDQMRVSTIEFQETDTAVPWVAYAPTVSANAAVSPVSCAYYLYVQLRNSETGEFSAVKKVGAIIDVAVQASAAMYAVENIPGRPAARSGSIQAVDTSQPYAPPAGNPVFTRYSYFYYGVSTEPAPCVGIKTHSAEGRAPSGATSYPFNSYVSFRTFDRTADADGVGYNEQTLQTTVVITDKLDNVKTFTRTLYYDDDPPVMDILGLISVEEGSSVDQVLVSVNFDIGVTDESYGAYLGRPDDAYWGVWVLATDTSAPPTPAQFAEFGAIRVMSPGSKRVSSVPLLNDLNPQMQQIGKRFIHLRFLDGAGNYTERVLSTQEIQLTRIALHETSLPMMRK